MIVLPDRSTSEENIVTHFWNSEDLYQVVTDGPDAECPECGYPERHRVYEDANETLTLIADGCPSCETSRMPRPADSSHDRDRLGICRRCGQGLTARDIVDGEKPCSG